MYKIPYSKIREIRKNQLKDERRRYVMRHNDEMIVAKQVQEQTGCTRSEALREAAKICAERPII